MTEIDNIRNYFESIDINQPLKEMIDRQELESAGIGKSYIDVLLGVDTNTLSIAELTSKVANAQAGPLLEIKKLILDICANVITQFGNMGIDFSKIDLEGTVVAGRIVGSSKKLLIIYGDNHISQNSCKEIAQGFSGFASQGHIQVLGIEDSRGEYRDPKASELAKGISNQVAIEALCNTGLSGGKIVEILFGDTVYTIGVDSKDLKTIAKTLAMLGLTDHFDMNLDERSKYFVDRLLETMREKRVYSAGLVMGADHIAYAIQYLNSQQVSYLVIMPYSLDRYDRQEAAAYNREIGAELPAINARSPIEVPKPPIEIVAVPQKHGLSNLDRYNRQVAAVHNREIGAELPVTNARSPIEAPKPPIEIVAVPQKHELSDEERTEIIKAKLEQYQRIKPGQQFVTRYNIRNSTGIIIPGSRVTVLEVKIDKNMITLKLRLDFAVPKWEQVGYKSEITFPEGSINSFIWEIAASADYVFEE